MMSLAPMTRRYARGKTADTVLRDRINRVTDGPHPFAG
jgi:hypothetical protein